ncbi:MULTISPECIES: hypothetical protein [Yersinia]|uniref:hypothetical protein n=1 Tax=Yersinia TaxID=629 RepID=UPI0005E52BA7|nr:MULTISPECIES: hypothetical protein [Yersinia]MDN0122344.1 hypothetical protein [Yersinia aleksiciae]CNE47554.1 Uncharacterised protein [Yersinia kristensenii]HEN3627028.1 hypothetical protein [Yersinia enterocolitica]
MTTLFHTLMARTGQRLLQQSHYPDDLEWRWSLGYCQGDGYACVGHLDNTALQQLLPALAERQSLSPETQQTLATLLSQSPIAVSLTLQDGLRYTHAGCIQIEILDFPDAEEVLYQTFYQILRQDLVSLCSEAEHQGYRLLNATLPPYDSDMLFERRTRHFALRAIAETSDDELDDSEDASLWDDTLDLLLHHGARLLTVRVALVCLTTGNTLAQDWQSAVLIANHQPVRRWFDREYLPELMQSARETIYQQRLAYQTIRTAA